jgi:hypothetical protein
VLVVSAWRLGVFGAWRSRPAGWIVADTPLAVPRRPCGIVLRNSELIGARARKVGWSCQLWPAVLAVVVWFELWSSHGRVALVVCPCRAGPGP